MEQNRRKQKGTLFAPDGSLSCTLSVTAHRVLMGPSCVSFSISTR
uniref:Uncharacterized protein n=1 Tax=Anguilla anguilla TaxID=7936 RepID=A0A0E9W8X0_ANGAN